MVKIPVPGSKIGAKPWGSSTEEDVVLGIDSCTTALAVNIYKTFKLIECSCYCCGL